MSLTPNRSRRAMRRIIEVWRYHRRVIIVAGSLLAACSLYYMGTLHGSNTPNCNPMPYKGTIGSYEFSSSAEAEVACKAHGYTLRPPRHSQLCEKAAVVAANRNLCRGGWTSDAGRGWWQRDIPGTEGCGGPLRWNVLHGNGGLAAAHCCSPLPPAPNVSGLPLCAWQAVSSMGTVAYPRGPQTGYSRDLFETHIEDNNAEYVRASWLNDSNAMLIALTDGSELAAVVGGNWSHDNDFDTTEIPKYDACLCFFGGGPAVCSHGSFHNVLAKYGHHYWMPLPKTKRLGWASLTLSKGRQPEPQYISWYGQMFEPSAGPRQHWWHDWRRNAIKALQSWDTNRDGDITVTEVVIRARKLVNNVSAAISLNSLAVAPSVTVSLTGARRCGCQKSIRA